MSENSKRKLCILGSTGSIGTQTLDVVRANNGEFEVHALAAGTNVELLAAQAEEFKPKLISVRDKEVADAIRPLLKSAIAIEIGREGCEKAASSPESDIVVAAVVGFEGLFAVHAAVKAGKKIALANKESLVAAGALLLEEASRTGATIAPIDSEHSSIYQCLLRRGQPERVRRIVLTASGGPFWKSTAEELSKVTAADAVKHPTWAMGAKISVDSATLMNKGLEVIEAAVLFDLPGRQIEVLIHPESIVHGMVEYDEGTMLAALFVTDMRVPIAYALKALAGHDGSSNRAIVASGVSFLDLAKREKLSFYEPDLTRFPALGLAYDALNAGGLMPAVLNAANEVAVHSFLKNEIGFSAIPFVSESVMKGFENKKAQQIEDVVRADSSAREAASKVVDRLASSARVTGGNAALSTSESELRVRT